MILIFVKNIYIYTYVHIHGSLVNPGVSLSNLRGSPKGVAHPQ